MGDPIQKLHSIAVRRRDIMREISYNQRQTPTLEHSHYTWASHDHSLDAILRLPGIPLTIIKLWKYFH